MSDIGSVSVRVVPSAKNFVTEFRAQTLPGMQRLGSEAGVLYRNGFEDSVGKLHVDVDADTTKARAQIAELKKAASVDNRQGGLLLPAIVGLGPALIPIAAEAAAAGGALTLMGISGVLAVQGIKKEMASGSESGQEYALGVQKIRGEIGQLQQTAAGGLLGPFNQAIAQTSQLMPELNREVSVFSNLTGRAGGNLLTGFIAGFRTVQPLITLVADDLVGLTADFSHFTTDGGLQKFVTYAQAELPEVEATLKAVAGAVGDITSGLGPLGTVSLTSLRLLSEGIDAIPVDVLRVLVPLAGSGYLAFRAWGALGPIFTTSRIALVGLNEAMAVQTALAAASGVSIGKFGAASAAASVGIQRATASVGGLSAASLGVAGLIIGADLAIAKAMKETAASAALASADIERFGVTGARSMKDFGTAGENLAAIIDTTFHESTLTKIKDFGHQLAPWTTETDSAKNFFKSVDSGLTQLATSGNVNAAQSALQDLATQSGESIDKLLTKLPDLRKAMDALNAPAQVVRISGVIMATSDSLTQLGKVYGISGSQAQSYASITGITSDQIKNSTVSLQALTNAVQTVSRAYATGNTAVDSYLDALNTFSQSAGTAADRATLISATLRLANGDNLSYAKTMVAAATANQQLVDTFKDGALKTVDWKTGLIDFNNAAAQPLISALDSVQTAALNAASATFQHEQATKGGAKAADDAYTTYVNRTQGALIDEAEKFGKSKDEAKKFADQYFGLANAPDIKKKIEAAGTDPVQKILSSIQETLEIIAGIRPNPTVSLNDQASAKAQAIAGFINNIPNYKTVTISLTDDSAIGRERIYQNIVPKASGGPVNDGWFTVGEQGFELGRKQGNKVQIFSNSDSQKMLGVSKVPGFASGSSNPFTGVDYTTPTSGSKAAAAAVNALASGQANIRFTTSLDVSGLAKAALGSSSSIATIMRKLITDVHTAAAKGLGSDALIATLQRENTQLQNLANQRSTISAKLQTANTNLAAARKLYNDERSNVTQAVAANFDITSVDNSTAFGVANPAQFIQNLQQRVQQEQRFATQLLQLQKAGLNKTLIGQLGEAGVSGAGASVASLASASAAQIAQVNALFAKSNTAAAGAGTNAANALYKAGVDSAQGYVNGLLSQLSKVNSAASTLAQTVIKQIKKDLGIKSPSTVAHELAGYTVAGYAKGIDDRLDVIRGASSRMANAAARPGQFSPDTAPTARETAAIIVNPGPGMDEEAIGLAAARRVIMRAS